ncbi:hypothetical protein LVJ82_10850 [Vitreoscilla massiliensis]|uniref:Uncharacterized protein n=1 Tax=Vitreoscilla massiliensis TaxID=1689272 RepID=A0ABY4DWV7_9NEIS|nr:hypothetical protein [Vitreoscilla massiliensis]UOO87991.1 hypothetical protein LVJ82_10850 [Vitreoscilla massiliensis]
MNQVLLPTPQQYLELHDAASDTLWQAELAGMSFLNANLQDDELKVAIRTMLTIIRASKVYDVQNIGALRMALNSKVAA